MKIVSKFAALAVATLLSANCTVYHVEMLAKSIETFTPKSKLSASDKVWVTSMADSKCDSGCQMDIIPSCGNQERKGSFFITGMLEAKKAANGGVAGSADRMAFEVFANYLNQNSKASVVEPHRNNYASGLAGEVETRKKIEWPLEGGKTASTTSCADLCLLDEAKQRKADKVLAYDIIRLGAKDLTIHFRVSNVKSGIVESAQTVRIVYTTAPDVYDASFVDVPEKAAK